MNNTKLTYLASLLSFCLSPVVLADEAASDAEFESIVVHGTLNETPLSELASSVSVWDPQAIEARHAQHIESMFNSAPNVNFASGASRGRFVQIRGIGERSQFVDPINPSVGYLVDGINYSGLLAGASMFDVAQVEVFKGPNSARFGADGLAGMINVITSPTSATTSVDALFGVANYGSWYTGLAAGGALSDNSQYRVSVHRNQSDGFVENTYLDRDDTNGVDELTARGKIAWQASKDLNIDTIFHFIDVDNGYDAFSLDRDRTTLSDEPGFDRQQSRAVAVKASYSGWQFANLDVQISHLNADLGYGFDEDWSYVGIAPGWEYSSTDSYLRDRNDTSIDVKLSHYGNDHNGWTFGAYLANKDEDLQRDFFDWDAYTTAQFFSDVKRKDSAVFGEISRGLSAQSWLTASLRLSSQSLDYADTNSVDTHIRDNDWGGELSYHYQLSENQMVYVSLQRSFKMGGVNGEALGKQGDSDFSDYQDLLLSHKTFEPESLLGTEIGTKGSSADGLFAYDINLFYQWRDDIQYKNWFVNDQSFAGFYNNAADGKNYGVEMQLRYQLNDTLSTFANLGLLKTDINGITREDGDSIISLDGREQAHAPSYMLNAGVNWQLATNWNWLVEFDAKDDFYYSYSHDSRSDKMFVVNTSLDYQFSQWKLSVYARNLFDRTYANRGFYFGNDPRDEYLEHTYEQFGEPRRVGISLSYHY